MNTKAYYQLCNDQFGSSCTPVWLPLEYIEHSLSRRIKTQETRKGMKRWLPTLHLQVQFNESGHMEVIRGWRQILCDAKDRDLGKACATQALKCVCVCVSAYVCMHLCAHAFSGSFFLH